MKTDWVATMKALGEEAARRTVEHDEKDSFVAENYAALKQAGAFKAGIPAELGGGDASHAELCAMIRELARHCSSTGLAFSMHTHIVATLAFIWRSGNKAPEPMLRRVAAEDLVLVSTGGADWLMGSGKLEKVEGGYRMTGRKIFASGVPSGDFLMTTGVYDDPAAGPTVIHFPLSLKADGVKVLDTWRVLGMRGTGSHDVELEGVFVPDAAMGGVRRPAGKFHPFIDIVCLMALPVIYSAYLGVAESARDLALRLAARKREDPLVQLLAGEMENQLVTAQLAHDGMLAVAASTTKPTPASSSAILARRVILANAAIAAVGKAVEVAGGVSFYRDKGLERLFRDIQAARFHPMPEKQQARFTGRVLLGLPVDV
jgi:alkylation response protein AidB-like acyl-CoA dehydrogenase